MKKPHSAELVNVKLVRIEGIGPRIEYDPREVDLFTRVTLPKSDAGRLIATRVSLEKLVRTMPADSAIELFNLLVSLKVDRMAAAVAETKKGE